MSLPRRGAPRAFITTVGTVVTALAWFGGARFVAGTIAAQAETSPRAIVVAELFTSEGCSSCPPADDVLADLVHRQPVPGVEVLALAAHVDYWNQRGWSDPFSSTEFSARQSDYDERVFRTNRIYTPQLVVDDRAPARARFASRHRRRGGTHRRRALSNQRSSHNRREETQMNRLRVLSIIVAIAAVAATTNAQDVKPTLVVTASNTQANELLVYDATGTPVQSISTQGQGGATGNAGGIATRDGFVAVVNFGSQTVAILERRDNGFEFRQLVSTVSPPVSVAFGKAHLYVLGLTTVESHRIVDGVVDAALDGLTLLARADGSAAQVGVAAEQLVISEKSGAIQFVTLQNGAVAGGAVPVALPPGANDTPFGLVTRGSNAYVTIAHSDLVALVKNGQFIAAAATGSDFPNGPGQQSPCWVALVGPYLYSTNTPSLSISRLIATGGNVILDEPVAALVKGNPGDVAGDADLLAVIESDDEDDSHLTLFRVDEEGALTQIATIPIASDANGVAIVPGR